MAKLSVNMLLSGIASSGIPGFLQDWVVNCLRFFHNFAEFCVLKNFLDLMWTSAEFVFLYLEYGF